MLKWSSKRSQNVGCYSDFAISCAKEHLSFGILENHLLYMMAHSPNENDRLKEINSCNQSNRDIILSNKNLLCGANYYMFCYCKNICVLVGKLEYKTWKLNVYRLETKATCATWEQVAFCKYSISGSLFNFQNCIPVSHREDRMILVSILNDQTKSDHSIMFHIFSQRVSGRNWKTKSSLLPIQYTRTVEYQITSCKLHNDYLYCSVLLNGIGVYIYKFDLMLLQQNQKGTATIQPVCNWHIREPSLHNLFLSVLQEEIVAISISSVNDRNILEVRRPMNFLPLSPADYRFEYPCNIKVVAASIISDSEIIVLYHDNQTNKYFVNKNTI